VGESSAATVREIEDIRGRLEANFQELERRMPAPAVWVKRLAGIAIGGGIGALVVRQVLKRTVRKRSPVGKVKRAASRPASAVIQVVPEEVAGKVSEALEDGRWKQWVAAGAGVWLALRLLELRQLRRLNRALIAGRA
jgi:hypothetical protein